MSYNAYSYATMRGHSFCGSATSIESTSYGGHHLDSWPLRYARRKRLMTDVHVKGDATAENISILIPIPLSANKLARRTLNFSAIPAVLQISPKAFLTSSSLIFSKLPLNFIHMRDAYCSIAGSAYSAGMFRASFGIRCRYF